METRFAKALLLLPLFKSACTSYIRMKTLHLLLLALLISTVTANTFIHTDTEHKVLVDSDGRQLTLHGVNVVVKYPPYFPKTDTFDPIWSLSDDDIANLREWGFNFIRLGAMWPGIEPERGVFNQTLLNQLKQLVDKLHSNGIYTLLDVHQDLYSPFFCGEGAPDWAVDISQSTMEFPYPAIFHKLPTDPSTGYPYTKDCLENVKIFAQYYFAEATGAAFQALYENSSGLQYEFGKFWSVIADTFKDSPGVVGYELINEPWFGDVEQHPSLLVPGETEKKYLLPFYTRMHEAIRAYDPNHILLFEPCPGNIGHTFDSTPGGQEFLDRQVFSYHVYCAGTDKHGDPRSLILCNGTDEWFLDIRTSDADSLGIPALITEFGAMDDKEIALESLDFVMGQADMRSQGWAFWAFKSFGDPTTVSGAAESFYNPDTGALETAKVKALSRTFAPKVGGIINLVLFDPETDNFTLEFTPTSNENTEIYLNENMRYSNGYSVVITPNNVKWSGEHNLVVIDGSSVEVGVGVVRVGITRN